MPLLKANGTPYTPQEINEFHRQDDLDRDSLAHHHSIGTGPFQIPSNAAVVHRTGDETVAGRKTFTNILFVKQATGVPAGIELGNTDGTAATPYIDFHSSGSNTDNDSRIIASGNRASNTDVFSIDVRTPQLGSNARGAGTDFLACDGTNEGGQANFKGAGSYGDVQIDNYQGHLRFLTGGTPPYVHDTTNEFFSPRGKRYAEASLGGSLIQAGEVSVSITAGGGTGTASATIDYSPDFGATPITVVSIYTNIGGNKYILRVTANSSTQATVTVYTGDGTAYTSTVSLPVYWIAIGT